MSNKRSTNSDIKIDESKHVTAPSFVQRLKDAVFAIILGAILVQVYFFYGAVKSGSFVPASIVIYFDSFYFLGYLAICGILGWISGRDFIDWLNVKISEWRFW